MSDIIKQAIMNATTSEVCGTHCEEDKTRVDVPTIGDCPPPEMPDGLKGGSAGTLTTGPGSHIIAEKIESSSKTVNKPKTVNRTSLKKVKKTTYHTEDASTRARGVQAGDVNCRDMEVFLNTGNLYVNPEPNTKHHVSVLSPLRYPCANIETELELLQALEQCKKRSFYLDRSIAVVGAPASGKTSFMVKFCQSHSEEYSHIFMIDASSPTTIRDSFVKVAIITEILPLSCVYPPIDILITACYNALTKLMRNTKKPTLLIFDSIPASAWEEVEEDGSTKSSFKLRDYLPIDWYAFNPLMVFILERTVADLRCIPFRPLLLEETAATFIKYTGMAEELAHSHDLQVELAAISLQLHGFPLAISVALSIWKTLELKEPSFSLSQRLSTTSRLLTKFLSSHSLTADELSRRSQDNYLSAMRSGRASLLSAILSNKGGKAALNTFLNLLSSHFKHADHELQGYAFSQAEAAGLGIQEKHLQLLKRHCMVEFSGTNVLVRPHVYHLLTFQRGRFGRKTWKLCSVISATAFAIAVLGALSLSRRSLMEKLLRSWVLN